MKPKKPSNLFDAVMELERFKNCPQFTDAEVRKIAQEIFDLKQIAKNLTAALDDLANDLMRGTIK